MSKIEHHIFKKNDSERKFNHFICENKFVKKIVIILCNILILAGLVTISIRNDIHETQLYVQENLNQIKNAMNTLAFRNQRYASTVTKAINDLKNQQLQALVTIHYYPKLKEFGFNRGIYPDNLLNGTLLGPGKPNKHIQNDTHIFALLDDLWAEQQHHSITYNYYYISHTLEYFYLSSKSNAINFNATREFFSSPKYKDQRSESQPVTSLYNGFYYTAPYLDFFSNRMVITIKSPVYNKDQVVGDIGVDIPVKSLLSSITLPNKLKSSLNLYLYDVNKKKRINIFKGYNHTLLPSIQVYTRLSNNILIHANISSTIFITFAVQILTFGLLILIALNYMNATLRKYKSQKQYYQLEAYTDQLTGLFNRRILDTVIKKTLEENRAIDKPISMIVFDANDFKTINDTYGHDIGDLALKHISSTIDDMTRDSDICIRLGGDEFCIILPNADLEQALLMADRLELAIFSGYFCHYHIKVAISTGCTVIKPNENLHDALIRADKTLYKNKENKAENRKALQQQLNNYVFKSPPSFQKKE